MSRRKQAKPRALKRNDVTRNLEFVMVDDTEDEEEELVNLTRCEVDDAIYKDKNKASTDMAYDCTELSVDAKNRTSFFSIDEDDDEEEEEEEEEDDDDDEDIDDEDIDAEEYDEMMQAKYRAMQTNELYIPTSVSVSAIDEDDDSCGSAISWKDSLLEESPAEVLNRASPFRNVYSFSATSLLRRQTATDIDLRSSTSSPRLGGNHRRISCDSAVVDRSDTPPPPMMMMMDNAAAMVDATVVGTNTTDLMDQPQDPNNYTIGVTENTPYSCQFCDKAFPRLSYLKRHEQTHSDQMPFKCHFCQRLFKHKRSRDRHIKLHTGDKKYRCNQCEAAFCRSDHLKIHMKTHDNAKPFQCNVCNRGYNTAAALTAHMQNHKKQQTIVDGNVKGSDVTNNNFRCLQCSLTFGSVTELQKHVLSHQGSEGDSQDHRSVTPTTLNDSKVIEQSRITMHRHFRDNDMLTASLDNRMLQCLYCGHVCLGMDSLTKHIEMSHTNNVANGHNGTIKCPICCDNFATLDLLFKHMKIHEDQIMGNVSGDTTYRTVINKLLTSPPSGSMPPSTKLYCIYCPKGIGTFMTFEALQLHVQMMHGPHLNGDVMMTTTTATQKSYGPFANNLMEVAFTCEICNARLSSVQSLQKHTLSVHSFKDIEDRHRRQTTNQDDASYCSQCKLSFNDDRSLLEHIRAVHDDGPKSNDVNKETSKKSPSPANDDDDDSPGESKSPKIDGKQRCLTTASVDKTVSNIDGDDGNNKTSSLFMCNQCSSGASFGDFESFRTHLKTHLDHTIRQQHQMYVCPECKLEFASEEQFDGHVTAHYSSTSTEYGCQCCMKLFGKPDELQKHLMDIHAHHLFRCALCRQVFDSKVTIQVHFAVKHSNECKLYKCTLCSCLFRSEMEFHLHVKIAHLHKSQPYRCLFCNLSFSSELELQYHLTTHKKQFKCKLCDEAFHVEFLLDKHVQTEHPQLSSTPPSSLDGTARTSPVTCKINYANSSPSTSPTTSSSRNFNGTTACKEYKCDVCDAKFKCQSSLTSHRHQMHNVNIISPTTTSGSTANNPSTQTSLLVVGGNSLTNHQALSLHCAYCSESCKSRTELENHMKSQHTSGTSGKHKCNVCDEIFPSATILAEHKLQHCKVVTSNTCIMCKCVLQSEQQFYDHINQHNGKGYPTPCVVCRQTLTSQVEIQVHSRFHLKNNEVMTTKTCDRCNKECDGNVLKSIDVTPEIHCCQECYDTVVAVNRSKDDDGKNKGVTLRCKECNVKFENVAEQEKHSSQYHKNVANQKKTYQCIKCQLSFDTEAEIQFHVTTHLITEGSQHDCKLCHRVFDSPAKLQCHLIEHTFEGCANYTCYICTSVFTSSQAIQKHMIEHGLSSRPYDCRHCNLKFFFRSELDNHSFVHRTPPGNYEYGGGYGSVASTDKSANAVTDSSSSDLNATTNGLSDYQCPECSRTFFSYPHLVSHVRMHRNKADGSIGQQQQSNVQETSTYRCSVCPQSFDNSVDMQQHYFSVHNDHNIEVQHNNLQLKNKYKCNECDKTFPCLSNLQGHVRIHSQGTKYTCNECNKEFALVRNLNIHMRSHSGEKPYECPICQKRFARKENRKAHIKSHSGIKPFMCPHCGKTFSRKCHVKEHMRVHFNTIGREGQNTAAVVLASTCEMCSESFASVDQLQKHIFTVHKGRNEKVETLEKDPPMEDDDDVDVDSPPTDANGTTDRCTGAVDVMDDEKTMDCNEVTSSSETVIECTLNDGGKQEHQTEAEEESNRYGATTRIQIHDVNTGSRQTCTVNN
ncbi:ZNF423 (predicted) [Pycnogonum litorale]